MDTKDAVLLLVGFVLGIIGGLIATRLDRSWTRISDSRSKRLRLRNVEREAIRLKRLTKVKELNASNFVMITESVEAAVIFAFGMLFTIVGGAMSGIFTSRFDSIEHKPIVLFILITVIMTGIVLVSFAFRKYYRMVGDMRRLFHYDEYKTSVDKAVQAFSSQTSPQAPSP